jgi:Trypsin-co-occurring domain 2
MQERTIMPEEPRIPLARAIEDLRSELLKAAVLGKGQPLQFRLRPIELELKLAVTSEGQVGGAIKFYVVDFSTKGTISDEMTHTLKLVLEPVGSNGETEFLVSEVGVAEPGTGPFEAHDDEVVREPGT